MINELLVKSLTIVLILLGDRSLSSISFGCFYFVPQLNSNYSYGHWYGNLLVKS